MTAPCLSARPLLSVATSSLAVLAFSSPGGVHLSASLGILSPGIHRNGIRQVIKLTVNQVRVNCHGHDAPSSFQLVNNIYSFTCILVSSNTTITASWGSDDNYGAQL